MPDVIYAADQSTTSSFVRDLQAGQPEGWDKFVERYGRMLYFYCLRRGVLNREDAEDVVQTVLQNACQGIAGFSWNAETGGLRNWLFVIARNAIADQQQRMSRDVVSATGGSSNRASLENAQAALPADESTILYQPTLRLLRLAKEAVQARVDPLTWQAFVLYHPDVVSSREVAEQLGMKPSTVREAARRVRKLIEAEVGRRRDDQTEDS